MKINVKTLVSDVLKVAIAVGAVLAIILNVANAVSLPAADVTWVVAASAVCAAIVNVLTPYASATVGKALKAVFKK